MNKSAPRTSRQPQQKRATFFIDYNQPSKAHERGDCPQPTDKNHFTGEGLVEANDTNNAHQPVEDFHFPGWIENARDYNFAIL